MGADTARSLTLNYFVLQQSALPEESQLVRKQFKFKQKQVYFTGVSDILLLAGGQEKAS